VCRASSWRERTSFALDRGDRRCHDQIYGHQGTDRFSHRHISAGLRVCAGRKKFSRLTLPPDVTGGIVKMGLPDASKTARAVVPSLKTIALVGDDWDCQVIYRHWKDEIPTATAGSNAVEIVGLTTEEIRKRVAEPSTTALSSTLANEAKGDMELNGLGGLIWTISDMRRNHA
jgi:hypothetical protein